MSRLLESQNHHNSFAFTISKQNQSQVSSPSSTSSAVRSVPLPVPTPVIESQTLSPALPPLENIKTNSSDLGPRTSKRRSAREHPLHYSLPMSRSDSGFSEGSVSRLHRRIPSDRSSTASQTLSGQTPKPYKPSIQRPTHNRARGSTPTPLAYSNKSQSQKNKSTSAKSCSRPNLRHRHTTPIANPQPTYEFFQFPSLPPSRSASSQDRPTTPAIISPRIQYWTSPETRRLEYAAIDAASQGLRGFVTKLVPSCILPTEYRQQGFCKRENEWAMGNTDKTRKVSLERAGSVRRYRLEIEDEGVGGKEETSETKKKGKWKDWFKFVRRV